jgi:hypothetical protein
VVFDYFLHMLHLEGIHPHTVRVNEDGTLARSSEFTTFLFACKLTLDTTGGYNSWLNGMVERSNRTIANKDRALLLNSNRKADKWFFAVEAAADIYRMTRHSARHTSPYVMRHKKSKK